MQSRVYLKRGRYEGLYIGDNVLIERFVHDETTDYAKAGEVEWRVMNLDREPVDVVSSLSAARRIYGCVK